MAKNIAAAVVGRDGDFELRLFILPYKIEDEEHLIRTIQDSIGDEYVCDVYTDIVAQRLLPTKISTKQLSDNAAKAFGVRPEELAERKKGDRRHEHAKARALCYYVMKNKMDYTLKDIGHIFGGRDHSTVINGLKRFDDWYETDEKYRATVDDILRQFIPKFHANQVYMKELSEVI